MARILIVSDDAGLKSYIQNHLLDDGNHTFILSRNTTEAISMLMEKTVRVRTRPLIPRPNCPCEFSKHERKCGIELYPVDLVISDRMIGGISGARFLEKVRRNLSNIRTLLVGTDCLEMVRGSVTLQISKADNYHFSKMLKIALERA